MKSIFLIIAVTLSLYADNHISLRASATPFYSGDTILVTASIEIPEGYHLYSNPLGPGVGLPLKLEIENSHPYELIETRQTPPIKLDKEGLESWTWAWPAPSTKLYILLKSPSEAQEAVIFIKVSGLLCKDSCRPTRAETKLILSPQKRLDLSAIRQKSLPFGPAPSETAEEKVFRKPINLIPLFSGLISFLIIGIFHPIVIKAEYHLSYRVWPIFLIVGIALITLSITAPTAPLLGIALSLAGFSSLWSIGELFHQRERVAKGWFPSNPKRDEDE